MYGTGTRSYNRSTEKRQSDKTRRAITAAYEAQMVPDSVPVDWAMCRCAEHAHPHPPHSEELVIFEYHRSLHYEPLQRSDFSGTHRPRKHVLSKRKGAPR